MAFIETSLKQRPLRWALGWVLAWSLFSVAVPIEAGYDVLHYQLQIGWSGWNGRLMRDLAPSGMHSYFNPLSNILIHGLILALPAWAVTFTLAVLQAACLPLLYVLCRRVLVSIGHDLRLSALLLALAGYFNYAMVTSLASVRTDHWFAAAFLAGLVFLVPKGEGRPGWQRAALAAFVVGLSMGLKLTAVIHAAGIAAAILVAVPGLWPRVRAVTAAGAAGLAGIALTGGWWFWTLWANLGNPVFPMANGIFRSPYGPPENFSDPRSLPDSLWDVLLFPVNGANRYNEYGSSVIQDLPIALLYAAILLMAYIGIRMYRGPWTPPGGRPSRALLTVFAGAVVTMLVWFPMFSIGRYAMTLWMLAPLLLGAAGLLLWPALAEARRAAVWFGACFIACLAAGSAISFRRVPVHSQWGPYVRVEPPASVDFEGATVIFTGPYPSAFLAPHLPPSATYTFALTQAWTEPAERELNRMVRQRIDASEGPFVAVMTDVGTTEGIDAVPVLLSGLEEKLGLTAAPEDCRPFLTSVDTGEAHWIACPLVKQSGS